MPDVSVIVPTLNERDNVQPVIESIDRALGGTRYEIVFVDDDSQDGTAAAVRAIAQERSDIRIVHRIGRRGLASATVEGMLATSAPFLVVMDGDLQHDESVLPEILRQLRATNADLVVATRNSDGGGMGRFAPARAELSRMGARLSRLVCRASVTDPMSGFFATRRSFLDEVAHRLSLSGFKILLDLIASARRPVRLVEVPYVFRNRQRGESKLDFTTLVEFLVLLVDKLTGGALPPGYVKFGLVGAGGVMLNSILLNAMIASGLPFLTAQAAAGLAVIGVNYFINNSFTFRLRRLSGSRKWAGLVLFSLTCVIGLMVNLQFASFLVGQHAAPLAAGACGIIVGSVWNYYISAAAVWRLGNVRSPAPAVEAEAAGLSRTQARVA